MRLGVEVEQGVQAKVEVMGQVDKTKVLATARFPLFSRTGRDGEAGHIVGNGRSIPMALLFLPHRSRSHADHCAGLCGGHCGSGTWASSGLSAFCGNL